MKIYFTTSISKMDKDIKNNCENIVKFLEKKGHKVLHKELFEKNVRGLKNQDKKESLKAQKLLTTYKKRADIIIVESTKQSLGIGQEISLALFLNKPVIVLYSGNDAPHVLEDEGKSLLLISQYNKQNLTDILEESLDYASSQQDTRFNFFVAPKHINFMDWIAKNKKIPRSVFLRRLIEREMANDDQYQNQ
jgi:hypothetical protein